MTIEELEQIAKKRQQENAKYDYEVNVCMDLACASQGADKLKEALEKAAEAQARRYWSAAPVAWGRARMGRWCAWIRTRRSTSRVKAETCRGDREEPGQSARAANCSAT